ncbi:MAG TPA: hypothetical protein VIL86_05225 [Tepidisphaeraceae bacterium]|jgi:hypothetical protein
MQIRFASISIAIMLLAGCQQRRPAPAVAQLQPVPVSLQRQTLDDVMAVCAPPIGWTAEPLKKNERRRHQIWLSPSGKTAYGVIYFPLPLPVGPNTVFPRFMKAMERSEGDAILLNKETDPNLPGIRFVAEGGLYTMRGNLIVSGWNGWAIYAGSRRNEDVNEVEMQLAEEAREHTSVGLPETASRE